MKENKMSRRSFLKAGAFASAAGMLAAAPAAAHAAAPNVDKAAEEENGLLGIFGGFTIRIDSSYKAAERLDTILGDVMVGGNVIVDKGFVIVNLPKTTNGG